MIDAIANAAPEIPWQTILGPTGVAAICIFAAMSLWKQLLAERKEHRQEQREYQERVNQNYAEFSERNIRMWEKVLAAYDAHRTEHRESETRHLQRHAEIITRLKANGSDD